VLLSVKKMRFLALVLYLIAVAPISLILAKKKLGPLHKDHVLRLVAGLPIRNFAALEQEIADIHDPSSDLYGKYGNPELFRAKYGPTADQVQKVCSFLQSQSLTVTRVSDSNLYISVQGKVADVNAAFNIELSMFLHDDEVTTYYDADVEPSLPEGVMGVVGFQNRSKLRRIGSSRKRTLTPLTPDEIEELKKKSRANWKSRANKKSRSKKKSKAHKPTLKHTTYYPTVQKTNEPTHAQTRRPTQGPTHAPTPLSTGAPSSSTGALTNPTSAPILPTSNPTNPTAVSTKAPTNPTGAPTSLSEKYRYSALTPSAVNTAYNFGTTYAGVGQIAAVYELNGYLASDITEYTSTFGLPSVPLTNVCLTGVQCPTDTTDAIAEVTLDIDLMIASAPGLAGIRVYLAPNEDDYGLLLYDQIASENKASVISSSWGLPEDEGTISYFQLEANAFISMAFNGQSMFVASGDSGAFADGTDVGVLDPASQAYVTAVGGTELYVNSDGSFNSETTWWDGSATGHGGGGGISSYVALPAYQNSSVVINNSNNASKTYRNVPDVSLNAEPSHGYIIYISNYSTSPGWFYFGGTSCAAPIWAGFATCVNQKLLSEGKPVLGEFNKKLYPLAQQSSFYSTGMHDINDGSTNGYIYKAVTGYDLCTGWGSMNGQGFLAGM